MLELTELIRFLCKIVSSGRSDEIILSGDETISRVCADIRKPQLVIETITEAADSAAYKGGDHQMREIGVILAFELFPGVCESGSREGSLPGINTFEYNNWLVVHSVPQIALAAR